jgi:hypothetical protein
MFKPIRHIFNLKRLVSLIAALWLLVTLLIIFRCITSPDMSKPSHSVDVSRTEAVNGA